MKNKIKYYSKKNTYNLMRSKIKKYNKKGGLKGPKKVIFNAKIVRTSYLYLNRRLLLSYQMHIEKLDKKIVNVLYETCIYNINEYKTLIKKYDSEFTLKEKRYMNITLKALKKYQYLHYYKDIIIAMCLRAKLNGHEGVARLIQSFI